MWPPSGRRWPGRPDRSLALALTCSCCLHLILVALPLRTKPLALPPDTVAFTHGNLEARFTQLPASIPQASNSSGEAPATIPVPPPPILPAFPLPNHYYRAGEIDEKAEPVDIPPLVYPEEAYLRRIEGTVVLRVFINASGTIDSVDLLSATPPGLFEQSALDAVLATRFRPARLFGRPVNSQKTLEIRFDPAVDREPGNTRPGK